MEDSSLKKKAAAGVFWAGVSNLVTQFLNMVFGIVLARILLPEDYGVVGMLAIFTVFASVLQEAGFGNALINKANATHRDFNAVFWFNFLASCIGYLVLFSLTPQIAVFYDVPELKWLGRIVFLGVIFSSLGNVPYVQLVKTVRTKQMAISSFICTMVSGTIGVILALCGFSFWGLAIQSILSGAIRAVLYFYYSGWRPSLSISFKPLRQFWKHGLKLTLMGLYTAVNNNLITVLLGKFYSKEDVGFYNQANKWNFMAYSVLSGAVNSVSQPLMVAGAETDEDRRVRVFRKMIRLAAFVSIPSMFCLSLVASEFIHVTITDKWDRSIPMLRILALGAAFIPLSSVYQSFVLSKDRSGIVMVVNCVQISFQLLAVAILYHKGVLWMIGAISALNVVTLGVWHSVASSISDVRLSNLWGDVVVYLLLSVVGVVFSGFFCSVMPMGEWGKLFFKIIVFVVLYLLMAKMIKSDIYRDIISIVQDKIKGFRGVFKIGKE